ncbi:MAG: alpha/beta hydrolase [Burkholderiales bacterium]
MPTLRRDGVELYYEVRGTGKPLLLIAGLAADQAFWLPSLPALSAARQVILLDNRGSGRTTPLDAPTGMAEMAADAAALLAHLDLGRADVVGHSMGGMIAQELALRAPAQVDRVVLAATAPVVDARNNALFASWASLFPQIDRAAWFRNLYFWVLSARFFADPKTVAGLLQLATSYPYQQTPLALTRQVEAIAQFDVTARLSSLAARTLVLAGTEDLLFPVAQSAAFAKSIPHATFVAVEGAAHSFPAEIPQVFTQEVLKFLG